MPPSYWNTEYSGPFWNLPDTGDFSRTREEIEKHSQRLIWRYMGLGQFQSVLDSECLRFTRIDQFPDIHEGAFSKPIYESYLEYFRKRAIEVLKLGHLADKYATEQTAYVLANGMKWGREHVLANCWHGNAVESTAMWAGYGKDGVAIQSTVGRLAKQMYDQNLEIQPVYYIDPDNDDMDYGKPYLFKHKIFAHEQEVRALLLIPEHESPTTRANVEINIAQLVTGVFIAPTASSLFRDEVETLLRKYDFCDIPVAPSVVSTIPPYLSRVNYYIDLLGKKSAEDIQKAIIESVGSRTSP